MFGLTRGVLTLIGVAAAVVLVWVAAQIGDDSTADYWALYGLVAAAGLVMALSQLLGGWTKWGWPRLTAGVFLLGFVPALVAGGLVILAAQPDDGAFGTGWADWLGAEELAEDLSGVVVAIAFGLGLAFGLTFDTTGPRVRPVEEPDGYERGYGVPVASRAHDDAVADEPTMAERQATAEREAVAARDRDGDEVADRDEAVREREEEYAVAGEESRPRRGLFRR
jgi:hypothetical protein